MTLTVIIDTDSDPGSWAKALSYPPYRQIDDTTWTNRFLPLPAGSQPGASKIEGRASFSNSFHAASNSGGAQRDGI